MEPEPPAPRTTKQVIDQGKAVYGPWKSDEGWGGRPRLRHRTAITPGRRNGKQVLTLGWEAKAEYCWGFWYYDDDRGCPEPAHVGKVQLRLRDSRGAAPHGRAFDFTPGIPDGSGYLRFDAVIDRPEAGTYTLSSRSGIEKTRGYYDDASYRTLVTPHPDTTTTILTAGPNSPLTRNPRPPSPSADGTQAGALSPRAPAQDPPPARNSRDEQHPDAPPTYRTSSSPVIRWASSLSTGMTPIAFQGGRL
ncbi:hypothetical protein [Streptomyces sp. CBMA152]|uniref:hypothetical protein n=1 Tax=Streptomyces sp. CBMA152 TaxID=1896312 RepID=UPI0016607E6B|nr:hypothetical protein [Streptomyces sp. CBMA152]